MKKVVLSIGMAAIAVAVGVIALSVLVQEEVYVPYSGELSYVPSDITKANEKFSISPSSAMWKTTDISEIKHTIVATFRGTVTDIGEPIDWHDNVGVTHGAIPVTIRIVENSKNTEGKNYQSNDLFTFYVDSSKINEMYYIASYEPEFEVGEEIIVHIAKSHLGPMGEGGDNYFVELGDFGKYKIIDQKAYNEKYHEGRPLNKVLRESL